MDSLDAVEKLLQQTGTPMRYQDITNCILQQGLWHSDGKTPERTINSQLSRDIDKKGDASRFTRTAPGVYALRSLGQLGNTAAPSPAADGDKIVPKLSFTDAAEFVLDHYADHQPMHYLAISDRILQDSLVNTQGKTPEATLYAMILSEIKRDEKNGKTPRFVKYGEGVVGLRKWLGEGLAYEIEKHNQEIKKKLLVKVHELTAQVFEQLIGRLLLKMGFVDVEVTQLNGDNGIDVRGTLVVGDVIRTKMAIQAKKWQANIQTPVVQQVRGSLGTHEQGMIITTSDFSKGARQEAERANAVPVALVNGKELVELLIEHEIMVKRVPYELINLDVGE